jgi:hypothetical protein
MYLDLFSASSLRVDAGDLRLTKNGNYAAGTVVKAGDTDVARGIVELSSSGRDLMDANILYVTGGSASPYKSSRSIYINVDGGALQTVTADLGVEANDIRITTISAQPFGGTPDIKTVNIGFAPASPTAGKPFQVTVDVNNAGTGLSAGLVSTSMNGVLVDTRMTPTLAAGEKATLVLTLVAPESAGPANISINGLGLQVQVAAAASASASPSPTDSALTGRVGALENSLQSTQQQLAAAQTALQAAQQEIASLKAQAAQRLATSSAPPTQATLASDHASAAASTASASKPTPGLDAVPAVLGIAAIALAARRGLK